MLSYISEHSSESLDLTEVAKVFNFNYSYLSSYFNSHIQEGFSEYLNKIRVEKACVLLKQTPLSIAEISESVGYSDQSYFCRVFKKLTGHTPSSYRRRYYTTGGSL
jgi:two-component system response regulator YesN